MASIDEREALQFYMVSRLTVRHIECVSTHLGLVQGIRSYAVALASFDDANI